MADRHITRVSRSAEGDVIAVANPGESWLQRRRAWAIDDIVSGRHRYFVPGPGPDGRTVTVVHDPDGPYLRSGPDGQSFNNLDSLEHLDAYPWDVAHDHAEVLAVHAALVAHGAEGQVLLLGGNEHDQDQAQADAPDVAHTRVYDVATNAVIHVDSPEADAFCCGHAFLPDGRLLIAGGTAAWRGGHVDAHADAEEHWSGARDCAAYNGDGTWSAVAPLQFQPGGPEGVGGGRWYPSLVTLGDGRILAIGGHPSTNDSRHGAWLPEIYDPSTDAWTYTPGHWLYVALDDVDEDTFPDGQEITVSSFRYYPRIFAVPGQRVFLASPTDGRSAWYDPASGLLDPAAAEVPPHGTGYTETNHTAVLLPLLPGDGYTPRVLFLGNQGAHHIVLDRSDADTPPAWVPTAPRDWPGEPPLRRHGCATLLPTGEVFFSGGIDDAGDPPMADEGGVLAGELYRPGIDWGTGRYDPGTDGWTTTAPARVVRNYHSVALLLPNGRVLTAGSNLDGVPGGDDVKEYRIEIYSPAYADDPDRPEVVQSPASVAYGEHFEVVATSTAVIERVVLIRAGSVTHAWDGDQRYVALEFTDRSEGVFDAVAPPDGWVAPPGPYTLWVVDAGGRPCRLAPFVLLG